MGGAGRMGAWPHRRRPHPMAPNVGALCRGASWPTDPGARRGPPGRHGGGAPAGLRISVQGQKEVLWCRPVLDPVPVRALRGSGRVLIARTGANRGAAGPDLPVSGHWPGPVLARPNTPLGRVVSRVAARSGTCARPPRAGQLRYVHPCAQSGTCARSPLRPLRPAPPRHLVRDLPWGEEGGVCTAPAVAGGRFCRNLRIRTRAPLGRVRVQVPDLRRHWVYKVPGGVGAALILRLRHAHETGPADKWQTTQRSA